MISILVLLGLGVRAIGDGHFGIAFCYFLGMPVSLAHAVVFDYVHSRLEEKEAEQAVQPQRPHGSGDVAGTPWAGDSGHTLK